MVFWLYIDIYMSYVLISDHTRFQQPLVCIRNAGNFDMIDWDHIDI